MSAVQSNISLGREVEFYYRVDNNDPANSALIMLVLATGGDGIGNTLRAYDDLATMLAANPEVTNTGYARKTLTDANLAAYVVDDTNRQIQLVLPIQTFATIAAGDSWDIVCVAYDSDTTAGTDANIIPIAYHELRYQGSALVPDGNDISINLSNQWITAA